MGVCGETVTEGARVTGFRRISSLCLRVARDIRGIAPAESADLGSVLILGAPGWGKPTLLRALCRCLRKRNRHYYGSANHGSGLYCRR